MQNVDTVNVSGEELPLVDCDDGALLALARAGHQQAYATLFARYSYAAHRLARHLGQKEDSDDVVSEAFAQVLDLLGRGKGPERAFRAYLFTTVRHECARRAKARKRVTPTDDLRQIDTPVAFGNGELDGFERSAIRAAYESLPDRWQTVLWHLDVEGCKPHELGPLLGLSPNSVSALVYRARAGLREAYLQQHVKDEQAGDSRTCVEHRSKLSAFVRRTASARDQERVHAHLESCGDCMAIYLDLQEVNREVGAIAVPAAAATLAGLSLTSLGAHLTFLLKGLAGAFVPAAAAIASATLIAVPGHTSREPQRQPMASSQVQVRAVAQDVPLAGARAPRADVPRTVSAASELAAPATAGVPSKPATEPRAPRGDSAVTPASTGTDPVVPPRPSTPPVDLQVTTPATLAGLDQLRAKATLGPIEVEIDPSADLPVSLELGQAEPTAP
ncbi:sigma-70 family RNA polymerase sigma factor [Aeromicrobium fastidiosum]|uniref:Sigma-70 family RNA polymerase sigma factor n=1 Tax=Aeromicrobium fastidiosum TaxID=52699 RepID=A0A641ANR7_9ACTN|nr:sigma-70 family RNA polymerase sigma factor [Aeromicrobium fastidiosum]KAA1379734.1 sigma-70 family RNA polymerase sigma factor [Aeromicrobium fastidiosum]MBP2389221.1 RNA polymerase sigma factor (sigma-70 family) [Aeromicrobium fastidiosum]